VGLAILVKGLAEENLSKEHDKVVKKLLMGLPSRNLVKTLMHPMPSPKPRSSDSKSDPVTCSLSMQKAIRKLRKRSGFYMMPGIRPITLSDGRSWKEMQIPIAIDPDIT
jgi:hypothetical protein